MKKNNKHKLSLRKGLFFVCIGLILSSLTACGPSDETAPVISKAELVSKTVTVSASDDVGVTGYLLTIDSAAPSKDDAKWSNTAEFSLTDYGTYYVWVKDEAGNISTSVEVVYESTLVRLAKDYDHLAWIIAPDTEETKVLKEQYGDLYPMVEPLTEQQIRDRWEYLVNYLVKENGIALESYQGGLNQGLLGQDFHTKIIEFRNSSKKTIIESNDPLINKYKEHYTYLSSIDRYVYYGPDSFTSGETKFGVGLDIIDQVSIDDMESFVRYYMLETSKSINMAIESNAEMHFYFDPLNQD